MRVTPPEFVVNPDPHSPVDWRRFLFLWVSASTVGWTVGFTVFGGTLAGLVVGIMQWLVLRQQVSRSGWWVLASTVGWIGGGFGGLIVGLSVIRDVGWNGAFTVASILVGAVTGVMQWIVLQWQVPGAGWWVLASTVGWTVGFTVSGTMGFTVGGVMFGLITGLLLVGLLQHPA